MTKRTLIERMKRRKAPTSWITEVMRMLLVIENKDAQLEEYLEIIDALVRARDTTHISLDTAWYQIKRAIGQLHSYDKLPIGGEINLIESVTAQLEAYMETIRHEEITID